MSRHSPKFGKEPGKKDVDSRQQNKLDKKQVQKAWARAQKKRK